MRLSNDYGIDIEIYPGDIATGSGRGKFRFKVLGLFTEVDTFVTREDLLAVYKMIGEQLENDTINVQEEESISSDITIDDSSVSTSCDVINLQDRRNSPHGAWKDLLAHTDDIQSRFPPKK